MRIQPIVGWLLCMCGVACAGSQAKQARDARMEQIDAQTVARTRLVEARQRARDDAIERRYGAAKSAVEGGSQLDKDAQQDTLEASRERARYQSRAVGRIETIRVRMDAARKKLAGLRLNVQEPLRRELLSGVSEYQALQQAAQRFPDVPLADLDAAKAYLEERLTHLNARVKALTTAIEAAQ